MGRALTRIDLAVVDGVKDLKARLLCNARNVDDLLDVDAVEARDFVDVGPATPIHPDWGMLGAMSKECHDIPAQLPELEVGPSRDPSHGVIL